MKAKPTTTLRDYKPPILKKIGSLKSITLKAGSTSDSSLPREI